MTDESFKYTVHHSSDKEERVSTLKDLYILLTDRMDFEVCKLERLIEKEAKSTLFHSVCYSLCALSISALTIILVALVGF